jgi:cobyrinic acid a,c-diamide synthase
MAVIIAGDRSGVGKTTLTLAILSYLRRIGQRVQSFKVGPDYIDPMFHSAISGTPRRNLDPVLTSEDYVRSCFARHCQGVDAVVVEGVMGLFDGIVCPSDHPHSNWGIVDDFASTAHIARLLDLPILLVLDCSRLSASVAAIVQGYRHLDRRLHIAGVILNRVGSDRHLELLAQALDRIQVEIFGAIRRQADLAIPDRHLGLVPSEELPKLDSLFDRLATVAQNCLDWEKILPLLPPPNCLIPQIIEIKPLLPVRIALARDRAFNFYYADNLDILKQHGAELIEWSPINDSGLPPDIHGIYFGGGFPEVFAAELAANLHLLQSLRHQIQQGLPVYAECGGLMYLCDRLVDFEGRSHSMVGILPATAIMTSQLTLGYRRATIVGDRAFLPQGTTLWGHEFHRSQLSTASPCPIYQFLAHDGQSAIALDGWQIHQVHASYLHLHFGQHPQVPQQFLLNAIDRRLSSVRRGSALR